MNGLRAAMLGEKKQVPFMQATKPIRQGRCEAKSFPASVCPFGPGRVCGGGNAKTITSLAAPRCLDKMCQLNAVMCPILKSVQASVKTGVVVVVVDPFFSVGPDSGGSQQHVSRQNFKIKPRRVQKNSNGDWARLLSHCSVHRSVVPGFRIWEA